MLVVLLTASPFPAANPPRVKGVAALGTGDLHTAVECLRSAVADFELANTTHGASYHFGIDYTEALARAGDVDAA